MKDRRTWGGKEQNLHSGATSNRANLKELPKRSVGVRYDLKRAATFLAARDVTLRLDNVDTLDEMKHSLAAQDVLCTSLFNTNFIIKQRLLLVTQEAWTP